MARVERGEEIGRVEGFAGCYGTERLHPAVGQPRRSGADLAPPWRASPVHRPAARPAGDRRARPALDWARAHLDQPITVQDLARKSGLSARQLARRMRAETGLTPLGWLHKQRLLRAQDLLERTDASVEQIAARCGMGTAATLRRHFRDTVGVSPTAYRTAFRA